MSDNKNSNAVVLLTTDNKKDDVIYENCHAQVTGYFRSQCGQLVEPTLKYFWSVVLHLLDDIFSFDSRASRALKPLLPKPGFLIYSRSACSLRIAPTTLFVHQYHFFHFI